MGPRKCFSALAIPVAAAMLAGSSKIYAWATSRTYDIKANPRVIVGISAGYFCVREAYLLPLSYIHEFNRSAQGHYKRQFCRSVRGRSNNKILAICERMRPSG